MHNGLSIAFKSLPIILCEIIVCAHFYGKCLNLFDSLLCLLILTLFGPTNERIEMKLQIY